MKRQTVEILFSEGCPHAQLAIERAREAIRKLECPVDLHLVKLEHSEDAVSRRYLGSPTVRVDGSDVDQGSFDRMDFGLQCRVYRVNGHLEGAPPVEWIERALNRGP